MVHFQNCPARKTLFNCNHSIFQHFAAHKPFQKLQTIRFSKFPARKALQKLQTIVFGCLSRSQGPTKSSRHKMFKDRSPIYLGMISTPIRLKNPCAHRQTHQNCHKPSKFNQNQPETIQFFCRVGGRGEAFLMYDTWECSILQDIHSRRGTHPAMHQNVQ